MISLDSPELKQRIEALNVLIRSHAGEIEVTGVSAEGVVSLRYTGMCAGCDYRPVTTAGTVEPALLDLPGVTGVRIAGARVSDDALARIRETLAGTHSGERAIRIVHQLEAEAQQRTEGVAA